MAPIIHVVSPSLNVDSLKLAIEAQSMNIFNIHKKKHLALSNTFNPLD
jgi:hypothetical protein